jgi:hypothetical protein
MRPVIIHADGTDCGHTGDAKATVTDPGGPLCPAGLPVTHVRFNGQVIAIEQACVSLKSIADAITSALTPTVTALAAFGEMVWDDPAVRVLVAACAVVNEEREREARERQ